VWNSLISEVENRLGWEVSAEFDGSPPAAPGVDVLQGGQIRSDTALGLFDYSSQGSTVLYGAVAKQLCDAHGQHAFEVLRRDPKPTCKAGVLPF